MNITIRKAVVMDAEVLASLGAKTFYDTFHKFQSEADMQAYIAKSYNADTIRAKLADSSIQYFLAFDGNTSVGYSKIIKSAVHEQLGTSLNAELEKIYVLQAYLDQKVGKALMESAIAFCKDNNFETLFLGVWQENHRAVNFYRKFGFEVFTTRTFQLGQTLCDDYLMKLPLGTR